MKKELVDLMKKEALKELESGIVPFHLEFSMERLDDMVSCIQEFEKLLLQEINKINMNKTPPDISPENKAYMQYHYDEFLGGYLRYGFFISLMSAIESILGKMCNSVSFLIDSPIDLEDLKGNVFLRSKKYLKAFGNFQRPNDRAWELICDFYALRNVLVHAEGCTERKKKRAKRLTALSKKIPGLDFSDGIVHGMDASFLSEASKRAKDFLLVLIDEMKNIGLAHGKGE